MQRYTERAEDGNYKCDKHLFGEAIDRLGGYEDTELSPKEIQEDIRIIKALWEVKIKEVTKESDFWKREAIKAKAQLGEIRILAGQELCDE